MIFALDYNHGEQYNPTIVLQARHMMPLAYLIVAPETPYATQGFVAGSRNRYFDSKSAFSSRVCAQSRPELHAR